MVQKPWRTLQGLGWTHLKPCFIESFPLPVNPALRRAAMHCHIPKTCFQKTAKAKGSKGGKGGRKEGERALNHLKREGLGILTFKNPILGPFLACFIWRKILTTRSHLIKKKTHHHFIKWTFSCQTKKINILSE